MPTLQEQQISVFIMTDSCRIANVETFKDKMNKASSEALPRDVRAHITMRSPAGYIYTSGTTGEANFLKVLNNYDTNCERKEY